MRKLRIWETLLSYSIGMKRKGRSILLGFGFVIGASVLILTVICFLFPSISPSLMNPLLQTNLDKYYIKFSFPYWLSSSSNLTNNTTSNTTVSPPHSLSPPPSASSPYSITPPPSTSSPYSVTPSPSPSSPYSTSSSPSPSPSSHYSISSSPSPSPSFPDSISSSPSPSYSPQSPTLSPSPELIKNHTDNSQTETNYGETNRSKNSSTIAIDTPKVGGPVVPEEKSITRLTPGNVSTGSSNKSNEKKQGNGDNCDISDGEWVRVNDPIIHYPPGSCPYLEKQPFDCHSNGKPDNEYLNWQWQWKSHPRNAGCSNNIPSSLNATDFLERLRGKKLVFSGDSLNRNMYMSMICIFWSVISDKSRIVRPSMYSDYKTRGDMSLIFKASFDYNCSVVFVWSPFLVNETNSKTRRMRLRPLVPEVETMRLDQIDGIAANVYQDADIVIFDSWHWWNTEKTNNGINYFQEGNYLYPKMGLDVAYKKAFTTWRRWIDNNIDSTKTQVVFRGFSLSHFVGGRWNTGGKCNLNTKPIPTIEKYKNPAPSHVKIIEDALRRMKTPVLYIDVGKLTFYRADAHPSIYGKNYTAQERKAAMHHQDCSHWCLPGVPDTWNELLYVSLLKAGKGSFDPSL
ncbi:hypothetical protein C5167_006651 [Papaver somniferum]|uniref:Uncharacterized protein n=1 Tax=Papaver somniferum TaxID=3469 RepID=A0A4Y7JI49_PAPSO|nr:hypothetical protein C5167_006651 [Papaver somniferum]